MMTDSNFASGPAVKVSASIRGRIHVLGESGVKYMMMFLSLYIFTALCLVL